MAYNFGSGKVLVTPEFDEFGVEIPVDERNPLIVGTVQEASLDFNKETKELFGSDSQFAKAIATGQMSIGGKVKFGQINADVLSAVFFGKTLTNGIYAINYDSVGTVIPSGGTVTVTPPKAGDFESNKGVILKAGSVAMKRVASSPSAGQYSVNEGTGEYTFATADVGKVVFITYAYTATSTSAKNATFSSIAMGLTPSFQLDLDINYGGKDTTFSLLKCVSSKLTYATKYNEFTTPEFEFKAQQNEDGDVIRIGAPV